MVALSTITTMKILVVEDQEELAASLKAGLEAESYAVDVETDGDRAFYRAKTDGYDLILLDNMLPGKDGPSICRGLREYKMTTPIMILSAQAETDQKVGLFECGADDYLTKPFSFKELSARVRALLRRSREEMAGGKNGGGADALAVDGKLIVADLVLDTRRSSATRASQPVYLTQKEYGILEYLVRNRGKVLSRSTIMEHVWDSAADPFSNNIETHIANLRRKIDRDRPVKLIRTIPRRGYIIDEST